jgi:RHS repeat-associated protein
VRQIVDGSGEVVFYQSYEPYGEVMVSAGEGGSNYGYAGEWTDASGLQYLRSRYYNTGIGIFTAKDPFAGVSSLPKTYNPYQYAFNNPILLTDPSGQSVLLAWAVETIILGLVGFIAGYAAGLTMGCITWGAALSGECGCEMQEEAMNIGGINAWNQKFGKSGAILGGLIPILLNLGAAATILVGGATVVMSVIDLYNTIQIMINETGPTACTIGRLILDFVGIISGVVSIRNGYLQFKETGKLFNLEPRFIQTRKILFDDPIQIQKKYKHAPEFGITEDWNPQNGIRFMEALRNHVFGDGTIRIEGTWDHMEPAIYYFDQTTNLVVWTDPYGNFVSGWKLTEIQVDYLLTTGNLGGR